MVRTEILSISDNRHHLPVLRLGDTVDLNLADREMDLTSSLIPK